VVYAVAASDDEPFAAFAAPKAVPNLPPTPATRPGVLPFEIEELS
jgi:hypothetical protein